MTTETTTPAPVQGATCTVGTGKTRWEIIRVQADGTLHLSKVGGDGYTNRWATADEARNIEAQAVKHTLGAVLEARAEAAAAAATLADQIKRHAKPTQLVKLQSDVVVKSNRYIRIYAGHLSEIQFQTGIPA
ncbi:hypothetical protein [Arthrobacter sp. C152]